MSAADVLVQLATNLNGGHIGAAVEQFTSNGTEQVVGDPSVHKGHAELTAHFEAMAAASSDLTFTAQRTFSLCKDGRWAACKGSCLVPMMAPSVAIPHRTSPPMLGRAAYETARKQLAIAFPKGAAKMTGCWGNGAWVVSTSTWSGVNSGPLGPLPATDKSVTFEAADLCRYDAAGKMVEAVGYQNQVQLYRQLGVFP